MVAHSKTSRKGGLNALCCLALLTLLSVASAQMFADFQHNQPGRRGGRFHDDDDEHESAVE